METRSRQSKRVFSDIITNSQPVTETEIDKLISFQLYSDAIAALVELPRSQHWVSCCLAFAEYKLNRKWRALCTLKDSLSTSSCMKCFNLLKFILTERPAFQKKAKKIIKRAIFNCKLPKQLDSFFRSLIQNSLCPWKKLPQNDHFTTMFQNYQEKGAILSKVSIKQHCQLKRALVAEKQIKPYENIIFLPESQIITLQTAALNATIQKLMEKETQLKSPKHCILSIFLLLEKRLGEMSKYAEYINNLPTDLSNFPVTFDSELLNQLQGTSFLRSLKKKKSDIQSDFKCVKHILKQENLTWEEFIWARMMISSRIFGIEVHGTRTDALVPIADMLNHSFPKMTSWYFCEQRKGFIVQNMGKTIGQGNQINDSYGNKCNSRFFLNYGFTIPNNPNNEVLLHLKRTHLPSSLRLSYSLDSDEYKNFMSEIRKIVYESNHQNSKSQFIQFDKVINFEVQHESWKVFKEIFLQQLQGFESTLKADIKIFSKSNLSQNYRNCVQIRGGQKTILQFHLNVCNDFLSMLTSDYSMRKTHKIQKLSQRRRRGKRLKNNAHIYEKYIEQIELFRLLNVPAKNLFNCIIS